jgi:hypothetical protein
MSYANEIMNEIKRQEMDNVNLSTKNLLDAVLKEVGTDRDTKEVDIITYVTASWGLNENPYPIQKFILKIVNGMPLDDRFDDEVEELISPTQIKVTRPVQFDKDSVIDIGNEKYLRVKTVDITKRIVELQNPSQTIKKGDPIINRILTWDKFRENITGAYREKEFLEFLYDEGPGTQDCRINISLEEYEERVKSRKQMNLVILRIGRRGTKCLNQNTLCQTTEGLVSLKEIKDRNLVIEVPNGKGDLKSVSQVYDNGEADTLVVKTDLGIEIEGTPEHKLWILNSEGDLEWKKLSEITSDHYVSVNIKESSCFGREKHFSKYHFEVIGMEQQDSELVPRLVRTASKDQIIRYLKGLIHSKAEDPDTLTLKLGEELAKQVQQLFLTLGIITKLDKTKITPLGEYDLHLIRSKILKNIPSPETSRKQYFPQFSAKVNSQINGYGYFFSKVIGKEKSRAYTLDLTVPDGNTYVASGLVTHNTSISQWMAAYNAYKILRKYYPQEYYRTRRDQPISMTLIATGKEQAQELLAPARAAMKRSPYLRRYVVSDSESRMTLNTPYNVDNGLDAENGLKIKAAPCSAKSVRGPANILTLLEEYGLFYYELAGSNKSDKAIYEAISPSLADLQDPITGKPAGMMMIISTPLTRESHMYSLEQLIWEKNIELADSLVVHLPSYWTNRLLTTEKLKADYLINPISFKQEYEACYTDQVQLALERRDLELCCQPKDNLYQYLQPGEQCFMGFDLGLKNDPTAIVIVAADSEGKCRVVFHETISLENTPLYVDKDFPNVLDINKVAQRVDYLWKHWRCRKGMGDQWNAHGFRPLLKTDAKVNLVFEEVNSSLNDQIAQNFLAYIYQRNVVFYIDDSDWERRDSLIRELSRLQRVETSGMIKKIKIQAPNLKGSHDDQYSALSRALMCAQQSVLETPPVATIASGPSRKARALAEQREARLRNKQNQKRRF